MHGLSLRWFLIWVFSHQGDLSFGRSIIAVISCWWPHQGCLSLGWTPITIFCRQDRLISVVGHQGGLISQWSSNRAVSHWECSRSLVGVLIMVVFHQGSLFGVLSRQVALLTEVPLHNPVFPGRVQTVLWPAYADSPSWIGSSDTGSYVTNAVVFPLWFLRPSVLVRPGWCPLVSSLRTKLLSLSLKIVQLKYTTILGVCVEGGGGVRTCVTVFVKVWYEESGGKWFLWPCNCLCSFFPSWVIKITISKCFLWDS